MRIRFDYVDATWIMNLEGPVPNKNIERVQKKILEGEMEFEYLPSDYEFLNWAKNLPGWDSEEPSYSLVDDIMETITIDDSTGFTIIEGKKISSYA